MKHASVVVLILALGASAQQPPRQRPAPGPGDSVVSPEVAGDSRVTFRLYAPKATDVMLRGEWMEGSAREKLARDEQGIWSVTVGPLKAELYTYSLIVDGVSIVDPRNPLLRLGVRGATSLVDVPGPAAAYHALRKVPHGSVHVQHYWSESLGTMRRIHVYTPPAYESNSARYPVLYLLHGSGDTDKEWVTLGRAGWITDNLLADGKARPMVIVMPDGHAVRPGGDPAARRQNTARFADDLLKDIMPLVERTYRVAKSPGQRAIAGLSMGGGQSLNIGLENLDKFSQVGVFSSGGQDFEERFQSLLSKPDDTNRKLRVFWIGCGNKDQIFQSAKAMDESLKKHGVRHTFRESEGGHVWANWRLYLSEMIPLLFRDTD